MITKKWCYLSLTCSLLLYTAGSLAATHANTSSSQSTTNQASSTSTKSLPNGFISCPPPSKLQHNNDLIWGAPGGWQSETASFATSIKKFIGAQWRGVNLGNIFCVYMPTNQMTFPITIQYNKLVYMPTSRKWGKNLGGYNQCYSNDPKKCAFQKLETAKQGDIYKQASQLHGSSAQEMAF